MTHTLRKLKFRKQTVVCSLFCLKKLATFEDEPCEFIDVLLIDQEDILPESSEFIGQRFVVTRSYIKYITYIYIYHISLFLIELNAFRLLFFSADSSKYYSLVRFLDVKLVYRGSILVSLQAPNSGDVILVCTQLVASAHVESSYYVTMFFDYLQFSDSHIQTWHVKRNTACWIFQGPVVRSTTRCVEGNAAGGCS